MRASCSSSEIASARISFSVRSEKLSMAASGDVERRHELPRRPRNDRERRSPWQPRGGAARRLTETGDRRRYAEVVDAWWYSEGRLRRPHLSARLIQISSSRKRVARRTYALSSRFPCSSNFCATEGK